MYGHPSVGPGGKALGVLELTALPSIDEERWVPLVNETDVLLAAGGDASYLCHWMRQSGLADLLPSLDETVWVGLSAGSMVMTPRIGDDFVGWKPPTGGDDGERGTLGERLVGSGVRDRRRDRHQSGRRDRRRRIRGALETAHALGLRPGRRS